MEIKKIMVIGAGQMGSGIAQVAAVAGFQVVLNDIKEEFVSRGMAYIQKNLAKDVGKGRLTEGDKEAILTRLIPSVDLQDAGDVDLAIEAAIENMDIKGKIFKDLDQQTPPDITIFHPLLKPVNPGRQFTCRCKEHYLQPPLPNIRGRLKVIPGAPGEPAWYNSKSALSVDYLPAQGAKCLKCRNPDRAGRSHGAAGQ